MVKTRIIMGMPILVEIVGEEVGEDIFEKVFSYFVSVDERFSTYKETSEVTALNKAALGLQEISSEMKEVFLLSELTKNETDGFFDIKRPDGFIDPSGLVKGWSIRNAARLLEEEGFNNFYLEAGGDIQVSGCNSQGENWKIGIINPFNPQEIIRVLSLSYRGVATSGEYVRGKHIYNPKTGRPVESDVVSLTVVAPDIYEADRFATAVFAMGKPGIRFIEEKDGLEGFMVLADGKTLNTSNFETYIRNA